MKYSDYAHPLVQEVLDYVKELEMLWKLRSTEMTDLPCEHINNLISFLISSSIRKESEIAEEIFRYFAAAVIYSEYIVNSFEKSETTSENLETPLFLTDDLKQRIKISHLNEIARDIETELFERTFLKDQQTSIQNEFYRRFRIRTIYGGSLASIDRSYSKSSIEFILNTGLLIFQECSFK